MVVDKTILVVVVSVADLRCVGIYGRITIVPVVAGEHIVIGLVAGIQRIVCIPVAIAIAIVEPGDGHIDHLIGIITIPSQSGLEVTLCRKIVAKAGEFGGGIFGVGPRVVVWALGILNIVPPAPEGTVCTKAADR